MDKIKSMTKNILDSNAYKIVIKPTLNIATSGYYDIVDKLLNSVLTDRKNEFLKFLNDNIGREIRI
jgi:hypothetical protein